jgi:SH3-like domain-containing protein
MITLTRLGPRRSARPRIARAALAVAAALAATAVAAEPRRGPETNLPLPRFVSLNVERANIRRGPSVEHRIDWVFLRRGEPLEVTAEHGLWRKVRDADAAEGWVHHTMLRSARTAVVTAEPDAMLRAEPALGAPPLARAERGAILRVEECGPLWCEVEAGALGGWAQKADLWGVGADEVFD